MAVTDDLPRDLRTTVPALSVGIAGRVIHALAGRDFDVMLCTGDRAEMS
jgi:hypothetical protein